MLPTRWNLFKSIILKQQGNDISPLKEVQRQIRRVMESFLQE